jgi:Ice-binding-like
MRPRIQRRGGRCRTASHSAVLADSAVFGDAIVADAATRTGTDQRQRRAEPGTAVVGFPPGTVTNGTIHATDAVAGQAQNDLTTAYNVFAAQPSSASISSDLAGRTLIPGVYTSSTSTPGLGLSGNLTLNAPGNPNAVFVFQAHSTLIAGSASHVLLINGARACDVYWQVGSSATIAPAACSSGTSRR